MVVLASLRNRTRELWAEHNPSLDTSPMEVVAQVKRIVSLLDKAVEPVYEGTAVTSAEVDLLVPIRYADEPITASRLADLLGMTRAGVSKTLAKLERRGLIARTPSPSDRRAAVIALTSSGCHVIDELFPRELAAHSALLAGLGRDRERVLRSLERLATAMEEQLDH